MRTFRLNLTWISCASFILMHFFLAAIVDAQAPANFSGSWEFDKTKSSPDVIEARYDGTVVLHIDHTASTVSLYETWVKAGNADFTTATESYSLDGKERVTKHNVGTTRTSTKWSQDKKVLTITNLDTQKLKGVAQDFLTANSYSLSDDGRILTIEGYSRNPVTGETTTKSVYKKK